MKKLHLASLLAIAAACSLLPDQAAAALLISITQTGNDVVVNGSGSLTTTGLTLLGTSTASGILAPTSASIRLGSAVTANVLLYSATFSGGGRFGTGGSVSPTSGTGNGIFGFAGNAGTLVLPQNYVSGSSLTGTSTYTNSSFATLGVTTGTYTYSYTAGGVSDTITLTAVPEPSTWVLLSVGAVAGGLMAARRQRHLRA